MGRGSSYLHIDLFLYYIRYIHTCKHTIWFVRYFFNNFSPILTADPLLIANKTELNVTDIQEAFLNQTSIVAIEPGTKQQSSFKCVVLISQLFDSLFSICFSVSRPILPPIPVEISGSGSGSGDFGVGATSGEYSGAPSGSGDHVLSGSGDQEALRNVSGSGDHGVSGDMSGSGQLSGSGDLSGSGESHGFPSGVSGSGSADASGSGISGEGSTITVGFSGADGVLSGESSASGEPQEAGEGSSGIFIFPPSEVGSGLFSGGMDLSGSGSGYLESGSSSGNSGESQQFSGISSGFYSGQDFSGFGGVPSGISTGSASGSGDFSGQGGTPIILIDNKLNGVSTPVTEKEYEFGGSFVVFSGSGDFSGSGLDSGDFSSSGSGSGFNSAVTFEGSGFTELMGSNSGEQETSGFLLYSSGMANGNTLYGFGSSSFISGSGSGESGEEDRVTFSSGDFTTDVSGGYGLAEEIKQASLEYSGDGGSGSGIGTSGSGGFHSGSGDNRMLPASGASSGFHSGNQAQVVIPSSTSLWLVPKSSYRAAEALSETQLSQTIDAVYGTGNPVLAPLGLSAAAPTTAGPPGIAKETSEEKSRSFPFTSIFPTV